jgi:hypothetical protein
MREDTQEKKGRHKVPSKMETFHSEYEIGNAISTQV